MDGLDCDACTFNSPVLTYGGGPLRLNNARFSGVMRVQLVGAAANTAIFLSLVQRLGVGKPPEPTKPNLPIVETATIPQPVTFSLNSAYGGK